MLKNASVTAFNISELWRDNQQNGGDGKITPHPTQIRVKKKCQTKEKKENNKIPETSQKKKTKDKSGI